MRVLFLELFCKIIMATWSEEEGSGSCTGQSIWRGGGWAEWYRPSEIDHLLSPLRSRSPVAISKQLHYEADQIKKRKKTRHTTICRNTTSVFKQSVRCGSRCWYSQQGWSQLDEWRPRGFIMKLLVLWEKAREPHSPRWLTSSCVIFY